RGVGFVRTGMVFEGSSLYRSSGAYEPSPPLQLCRWADDDSRRPFVLFAPPMVFRVPAPAAPDDALRVGAPRIFFRRATLRRTAIAFTDSPRWRRTRRRSALARIDEIRRSVHARRGQ